MVAVVVEPFIKAIHTDAVPSYCNSSDENGEEEGAAMISETSDNFDLAESLGFRKGPQSVLIVLLQQL